MPNQMPRHSILKIPTDLQSNAAASYALFVYRRILANWASDLLTPEKNKFFNLATPQKLPIAA